MLKIFLIIAFLASVSASETVSVTEASIKKDLAKLYEKNSKIILQRNDTISHSKFEIPQSKGVNPTYHQLIEPTSQTWIAATQSCVQCVLGGGSWPKFEKNEDSICIFPKTILAALKKADLTSVQDLDTNVPVTIHEKLTYEAMFHGLAVCGAGGRNIERTVLITDSVNTHQTCVYKQNKTSISVSWTAEKQSTQGSWCYFSINLPTQMQGGLFMTYVSNELTQVALKLYKAFHDKSKDQYFINRSFDSNAAALGKKKENALGTEKIIPVVAVKYVDIFMKQPNVGSKEVQTAKTAKPFSLTIRAASYKEIYGLIKVPPPAYFWVMIAVVLLCLLVCICLAGNKFYVSVHGLNKNQDNYVKA